MRKSKLRAWHIVHKEWLSSDIISQYITIIRGEVIVPTNVILSWWTGLKDIKGTEVYESDILGVNKEKFPDDSHYNREIIFKHGCFGWNLGNGLFHRLEKFDLDENGMACIVIGNVPENPELLKQKEPATV